MSLLLDTSVLIRGYLDPSDEVAISAISLAELHFGVLVATDDEARVRRLQRLATIEEAFFTVPFDTATARECGILQATVKRRGGKPRRRSFDLAIAATAKALKVPLMTLNPDDFKLIEDLVEIRSPD